MPISGAADRWLSQQRKVPHQDERGRHVEEEPSPTVDGWALALASKVRAPIQDCGSMGHGVPMTMSRPLVSWTLSPATDATCA